MPALSSINTFVGDGARTHWEFSFDGGYISPNHVFVKRNGELDPATLASESTVVIAPPAPLGEEFQIVRRTPKGAPIVDFAEGARLTEENLDTVARQALFVAAESLDRGEGALEAASPRFLKVPANEVAPVISPRGSLNGKVLGMSADGTRIIGINWNGTDYDLETPFILHEGQSLDTFINGLSALIEEERLRLNQQIEELIELADTVVEEATSTDGIRTRLDQLVTDFDALSGVVDALTALEGDTDGLATLIANETSQRITSDTAMAATIALIGAKNGANNAFILNLDTVKVSSTESLAQRFTALKSATDGNLALIQQEASTRAADDLAEVTARTQMGAQIRADTSSALSAAINTEATARVAGDQAEASARNTLAATLRGETSNAITAAVDVERVARIAGDNAEASNRVALAAALRTETDTKVAAAVGNEATARANADAAEATARQNLGAILREEADADKAEVVAMVVAEQNARATAVQAEASARNLLAGRVGTAEAAIATEQSVRASADSALSTRVDAVVASTANNAAAIGTEQTARAAGDTAIANSVTALTARVGSTESAVTTQAAAIADVLGRTEAYWEVTAVAGGRAKLRVFADANGGGGVDIEGDVRISGDLLVDGTVTSNELGANAATAGSSSYIADTLSVTTSWQDVASVTLNMTGGAARVDFCALVQGVNTDTINNAVYIRLLRGTTVVREGILMSFPHATQLFLGEYGTQTVYQPITGTYPTFMVDTSGASGSVTYKVQLKSFIADTANVSQRQMAITEFRR